MSLAIAMNLIAIVVVVGGWSAAVSAVYKKLSDPHSRPEVPRPGAVRVSDDGSRREQVLIGSNAG